jgi:5-methylcytosine-specific restriction endonuclease McrA
MRKAALPKRYSAQLGTEVSNALRKLARKMLHAMAVELGRHYCSRCAKPIERFEEMSLDHHVNWINRPDAKELFWDLTNVGLSHTSCNVAEAGRRKRVDPEQKRLRDNARKAAWAKKHAARRSRTVDTIPLTGTFRDFAKNSDPSA